MIETLFLSEKPAELSIASGVREFARSSPDTVAVIDGPRRLTYKGLDDRSSRLARHLLDRGLVPGDRVAVLLPNRLEWMEIACGLAKAGLVLVPLNTRSTPAENAYVLGHSGSRALILDTAYGASAGEPPPHVLELGGVARGEPYESALATAAAEDPRVPTRERDPFTVVYTSGTTGRPKGVVISHRSRVLTFYCAALDWRLGPGRTTVAVAPMYHGAGFAFGYAAVFTGGTVAMLRAFDPAGLLSTVAAVRAQTLFLVPTHAQMLRASGLAGAHDTGSLDTLYFNAAALPAELKRWVLEAFPGVGVHELYGSTEAGVMTNCRPPDALRKAGSVGPPWFLTEIRIVDDRGAEVPRGERGELFSRSPFLMNGYLGDEEATRACTTPDGFLTSGDIAVQDADGFVTIVDRKKDMIISGGVNVAPREVEDVLAAHPGVAEAAVVGVPDEQWGERVTAYVVALAGHAPGADELVAHCRERLSGPKIPRRVEFLPGLPRNAAGKVLKRELRERG